MNIQTIALWAGIAAGGAAIYGVHQQSTQQATQQAADATKAAVQRQQAMDALYTRLGDDETAIAAIATQLPQDKRELLTAIRAAQREAHVQPMVTFEKSERFPAKKGKKK